MTPEQERAFRVMEWANMHGDDLSGWLRLDPDDDAEAIQVIDDALRIAGDYFYLLRAGAVS